LSINLMKKILLFTAMLFAGTGANCQNMASAQIDYTTVTFYDSLPAYPEEYSAGAVAARLVDGLGFRYRWATDDLREEDLAYRPDPSARTSRETLEHIYWLSETIINAVTHKPNHRPTSELTFSWEEIRYRTLENFSRAGVILNNSTDRDIANYDLVFQRGENSNAFPFWHHLNGPIADALWHTGQIVSYRRSSGNPFDNRANVFMGTVRSQ